MLVLPICGHLTALKGEHDEELDPDSLSPLSFSTTVILSLCHCSQSTSTVDTSTRLPRRATVSGRQSKALMNFSPHSSHSCHCYWQDIPICALQCHGRRSQDAETVGNIQLVSFGLSSPHMVAVTLMGGSVMIFTSRSSMACLQSPG